MTKVLSLVVAASLVVATASAGYARGEEHHSAPWDLLPDIQARLVVHRAMSFKRSAPCGAIPALQALPPDIDSRTIIPCIICTI